MRVRTTSTLLVLALAAWAVWLLWLRKAPGVEERHEQASRLLVGFEVDSVDRITLERPGGRVVLVRDAKRWRLEQPLRDAAETSAVETLLREVEQAKALARLAPSEIKGGDEATGLGRDAVRVQFAGRKAPRALVLGSADVPGGRRFARIDGAPELALVDGALAQSLGRPLEEFRDHALFTAGSADIVRLKATISGRAPLVFERRGGDRWWITEPLVDEADGAAVGGVVSRILGVRAERFLDGAPADRGLGLDAPAALVQLFDAKERSAGALVLGRETEAGGGQRYGRVDGREARFQVNVAEILGELSRPPATYRSRLALDFSSYDVAEFELARSGATVTVRRTPADPAKDAADRWTVVAPSGFPLDEKKATDLVSRLSRVEARRLADGVTAEAAGLASPAARLVVVGPDPKRFPRTVLEIGGSAGAGETYARLAGRPAVLVLDEKVARDVDPAALKR